MRLQSGALRKGGGAAKRRSGRTEAAADLLEDASEHRAEVLCLDAAAQHRELHSACLVE